MTQDGPASTRIINTGLVCLAAVGGILIWSIASHVPNDGICAAVLPVPRACDTALRQMWAVHWILSLAAVGILGVLSVRQMWLRGRRAVLTTLAAESFVIALACLAVRP
ncbi:hypothetical protein [Cellulomonas soli]|uniref:Uncharacterized protein n=1 Tax=Cellulomonas soli TaxID=931535 RepID=A0A512P8H0_9CELL|nr:hypothetical protein [Cellulomonas soli]NYI57700.1 hypothetical protein [Cellulomonas soli]GEP67480.1 hypothetical protein CSO01_01950 [Cellulomonas soli]